MADPAQYCCRRYTQYRRNFVDGQFATGLPVFLTIDRNRVIIAQRTDTPRCPRFVVCGTATHAVEYRGNHGVWLYLRQRTNELDRVSIGDIAVLTCSHLLELYLGVIATLPMQHEVNDVTPYGAINGTYSFKLPHDSRN